MSDGTPGGRIGGRTHLSFLGFTSTAAGAAGGGATSSVERPAGRSSTRSTYHRGGMADVIRHVGPCWAASNLGFLGQPWPGRDATRRKRGPNVGPRGAMPWGAVARRPRPYPRMYRSRPFELSEYPDRFSARPCATSGAFLSRNGRTGRCRH